MLTGAIHPLCISGSFTRQASQGAHIPWCKGGGCSFSLRPRQTSSICHFQGQPEKALPRHFHTDTHSKQQLGQSVDVTECSEQKSSLFFFLMVLLCLVCAKRTAFFSCSRWQEPGQRLFTLPIAEGEASAGERWTGIQRAKTAGGRRDWGSAEFIQQQEA